MRLSDLRTAGFLAVRLMWRGSKAILFLTPLVIGLAIANLVFFAGLFGGLFKAVDKMVLETLFSNVIIEPARDHVFLSGADQIVTRIKAIPGVLGVTPHYKARVQLGFDRDKDGRDVKYGAYTAVSVQIADEESVMPISEHMAEGRYLQETDRDAIVIGNEVAGGPTALFPKIGLGGVHAGDEVTATFANGVHRKYTVVGVYRTGHDASDAYVYVTHKEMESVLGIRDAAHEIMVKTEIGRENDVVSAIRALGLEKETITTWYEFLNYIATMTTAFDFLKLVTGLVSMIVVNVTVFIVMFINVINRRRQLGILRAIGVSEDTVILSFVLQTVLFCLAGLAFMAALIFGVLAPYIAAHPLNVGFGAIVLHITPWDVATAAGLVFATNVLAGWIPAWSVTRGSIIRSIWGT